MLKINIPLQRMMNQQIASHKFCDPAQIVAWMGGVQAQDYSSSLWAVGLRTAGIGERVVEQALEERIILRTWLLRGTLQLVSSAHYRYERIIEDLAVECEQVLEGRGSDPDRSQAQVNFKANFQPGGTIEIARNADRSRGMDTSG